MIVFGTRRSMTIIPVMLLLIQQLKIIVCFRLSRMIVTPFHNIQCRRNNHPQSLSLPKVQTSIQHAIRDLVKSDSDKVPHYCICPQCARAYILNSKEPLKNPGEQVRCDACNKEWFLHASKVQIANNLKDFIDHTETPQHISKRDIYVANVPYEYSNDDLGALFQEYGVSNAFVVLDKDKNSKGFGFLEIVKESEAERAVTEMNGFLCGDGERPLKVAMAKQAELRSRG